MSAKAAPIASFKAVSSAAATPALSALATAPTPAPTRADFIRDSLKHGVGTAFFCLLVALALTLATGRAFSIQLAYSLGTGMPCWLLIELGRYFFRRKSDLVWPGGWRGPVIVTVSIGISYVIGTLIGDAYCGCSTWAAYTDAPLHFRASIVISVVAGLVGSLTFYSIGKAKALQADVALAQRDAAQAAQQASEARLRLLESQIEPHMLFNTLANLRALISTDAPRALAMLDHLNSYLRATLGASRVGSHSLQTEFDRLRDYLELMAIRMGPRLVYTLDLPSDLASYPVPPLLLQPLVENALKHGLEPQVAGGSIAVAAALASGKLTLSVVDTGVGLAGLQSGITPAGFGLAQVRERLHTLHGSLASLHVAPNPRGGACVVIHLPLQST